MMFSLSLTVHLGTHTDANMNVYTPWFHLVLDVLLGATSSADHASYMHVLDRSRSCFVSMLGLDTGLLPLHAMAISSSACLATSKLLVSQALLVPQVLLGLELPPVPQEPRAQASQLEQQGPRERASQLEQQGPRERASQLEQQLPAALVPLESP